MKCCSYMDGKTNIRDALLYQSALSNAAANDAAIKNLIKQYARLTLKEVADSADITLKKWEHKNR